MIDYETELKMSLNKLQDAKDSAAIVARYQRALDRAFVDWLANGGSLGKAVQNQLNKEVLS